MSVIYIVLPLALALAGGALAAFLWAVRKGQFDDLETPAIRVALEDDGGPVARPERSRP
jgi:cbb3-type cytochrome oxidase maturation protein